MALTLEQLQEKAKKKKKERLQQENVQKSEQPKGTSFRDVKAEYEDRTWFQKSTGNLWETILGSAGDVRENASLGLAKIPELFVDTMAALAPYHQAQASQIPLTDIVKLKGSNGTVPTLSYDAMKKDAEEFIKQDLLNEEKFIDNTLGKMHRNMGIDTQKESVFGAKSDSLAQSGGQLVGQIGLQSVGVPWYVTTGATSFGGEMESALNQGASFDSAFGSALVTAGSDILTEKLFGGSGLGEKGLINTDLLTKGIANKTVKTLADFGIDVVGEGVEEGVAGVFSNLGTALYKEENLGEILASEEAFEGYLESFIGGMVLGGSANVGKVPTSIKNKTDYRTGLTKNEQGMIDTLTEKKASESSKQKAIEKEVEKAIAERETSQGGTLSESNKEALKQSIMSKIDNGEIDTSSYQLSKKERAKIQQEIQEDLESGKFSLSELEDLATAETTSKIKDLESQLENAKTNEEKSQIENEIEKLRVDRMVELQGKAKENKFLGEAVYEKTQEYAKYTYDKAKVKDTFEQETRDSATTHANNTKKTRQFVDSLSKLAKAKQTSIRITNNQELLEQGDLVKKDKLTTEEQAQLTKLEKQLANARTENQKRDIQNKIIELTYMDNGGLVRTDANGKKTILVNIDSKQAMYEVVGHETRHLLEADNDINKTYNEKLFAYAKQQGDLEALKQSIKDTYNTEDVDTINSELSAKLTGKYLFENPKFLESIIKDSDQTTAQKIVSKIKEVIDDLIVHFKGTEQEKQLREIQKTFKEMYKQYSAETSQNTGEKVQHSVANNGKKQYSLSDNKGNAVSPAMQKRLANTKSVDKNGDLKVLYHGTANGEFTIFDKSKGNVEGDFGSGFYFTDNEADVEANYEGGGPDFENKVSLRAEEITGEKNIDYKEAEELARKELYVGANKFQVYLDIKNPAVVGETILLDQDTYLENYDESDYDSYEEYIEDVEQLVIDDIDSIIWEVSNAFDIYRQETLAELSSVLYEAYYNGGIEVADLKNKIGELNIESIEGHIISNEVTRMIIESLGYDGIIDSTVSTKFRRMGLEEGTTHYIVFKPNQIKSITNQNPTDNPDINMSLSQDIAPVGNRLQDMRVKRDIAPVREDQSVKVNETAQETQIAPSVTETVQEEVYAPMTEEEANEMIDSDENWERMRSLQEAEETPSVDEPIYSNDTSKLTEVDLREVRKGIKDKLPLQRGRTQEFNDIIQRYSTSEFPNRDALFNEIKEKFGKITVEEEIADVVEVQNILKKTRIDVSDKIKKGVTDYLQTMRRNAFKIRFSKDGMPVDVVYQELSEQYPHMFPEDIANEVDQFEQIISVANMLRTETGEFSIDDDAINDTVNSIMSSVRDVRQRHNQNVAERRNRWFDKDRLLEEYMQTDDYEALTGNPNLLKVFHERWENNRITTEPQIDGTVAQILEEEPMVQKKGFRENIKRKWAVFKANFIDKGAVFEDLSKVTKNRQLEAKWDYTMLSDAQAQHYMQNGFGERKSLDDIRSKVENTGFSKEFSEYMYHALNVDRMTLDSRYGIENKTVFGSTVTADVSKQKISELESAHPEFKEFAQDVYNYMSDLRQRMVQEGILSQETADMWAEMYPHYVPIRRVDSKGLNVNVPLATDRTGVNAPIKRATGGNSDILPLFDTMAQRTMQTFKAINKNDFGIELKDTLGSTIVEERQDVDSAIDMVESQETLLRAGENGYNPTFTVFENGQRVTFEITQEMYEALLPMSDKMRDSGSKILQTMSAFHRGVLTEYNPVFALTNGIKDAQDILINSQHPLKTYAKIVEATQQLINKGDWYQEYMRQGGENNSYFDTETNTIAPVKKGVAKVLDTFPLKAISDLNNFIERVPRLAEYIASREMGRSVQESMLDASRVTTNFKAGGDWTKFINKNGGTFLNASVQGAVQQARNVREANMNGLKGWGMLATKFAIAGLPALLLNHLLWGDDDEYEELSDYVKQNYYVIGKYGDGQFIRIPKGRTVAVIQEAVNQVDKLATGDDDADLKTFLEVLANNLAPNNPITNNVIAPIIQASTNKTWYGGELVPQNLQDLPSAEQYDESTDSLSKAIGGALNISPMKINYLLDQYTGLVGDMILPAMTPEVTSGTEGVLGYAIAPLKDKFTTDGVMNKQVITDFYSKSDELTTNAKKSNATSEDILKNKYINSVKAEMNELYAEKREIQNSNLPNKMKYEKVRAVQKKISALAEEGMSNYENVEVYESYGKVNDRHFRINSDGEWQKINDTQLAKQRNVTSKLNISANDYWSRKEEYDYAYENPGKYGIAKAVGGYDNFTTYSKSLKQITATKDKYGKTINGSRKAKVVSYLNTLNADYYTKILLYKTEYPSDDTYNQEIVEYLNNRNDISYQDMVEILTELGFKVSSDGTIRW
jgi:hypothetical protein